MEGRSCRDSEMSHWWWQLRSGNKDGAVSLLVLEKFVSGHGKSTLKEKWESSAEA